MLLVAQLGTIGSRTSDGWTQSCRIRCLTTDPISVFGSARKQIADPLDESIGPAVVDSA